MRTLERKPATKKSGAKSISSDYHLTDHPHANLKWSMNEAVFGQLMQAKEVRAEKRKRERTLFLSIGLCVTMLLIVWAFDWKMYTPGDRDGLTQLTEQFESTVEIPQTEQIIPPTPKVEHAFIIEAANEEIIEQEIKLDLDVEITEEMVIQQVIVTVPMNVQEEEKAEEIFVIVEQQPSPVGGMAAFYKYVSDNLKYPEMASRMNIQGRVFVQFVIEKDGSITDVQVVKGIGAGCDEEAIRVVSQAPAWEPGKQRGRPVRVRMIIPIVFKLIS